MEEPANLVLAFFDLFLIIWDVYAENFFTFPDPVILNLFLAPECVFILGIMIFHLGMQKYNKKMFEVIRNDIIFYSWLGQS